MNCENCLHINVNGSCLISETPDICCSFIDMDEYELYMMNEYENTLRRQTETNNDIPF